MARYAGNAPTTHMKIRLETVGSVLMLLCTLSPVIFAEVSCPVAKTIYKAAGCCNNKNATIASLKTSGQMDVDFSLKVSNLTLDNTAFGNGTGEMNFQADGNLTVMIARPLFGMFTLPMANFSRLFETPGEDTFEMDGPTTILQHSQGAYVFKMTNFTISSRTDCDDCGYNISVTYSTVGTLLEQSKCKTLGCPPIDEKLMMPTTNLTIADAYLFIDSFDWLAFSFFRQPDFSVYGERRRSVEQPVPYFTGVPDAPSVEQSVEQPHEDVWIVAPSYTR